MIESPPKSYCDQRSAQIQPFRLGQLAQFGLRIGHRAVALHIIEIEVEHEADGLLGGLLALAGQTEDEMAHGLDADFLAAGHGAANVVQRLPLLGIVQDDLAAALDSQAEQVTAGPLHGPQDVLLDAGDAGGGGPANLQAGLFDRLAYGQHVILVEGKHLLPKQELLDAVLIARSPGSRKRCPSTERFRAWRP